MADPSVRVRSGASTGAGIVGSANKADQVTVSCYALGDYVNQGSWPSNIWDYLYDPRTGARGYAADTWIQTSADVRSLVNPC